LTTAEIDRAAPPFWTWLAALALGLVLSGAGWAVQAGFQPKLARETLNLARLDRQVGDEKLIVLVGSSKLRCAVEADTRLADRLAGLGQRVRVVRVTRAQATGADFVELLRALLAHRPAIVLIQSDLVLYEPNVYVIRSDTHRSWQQHLRDTIEMTAMPRRFEAETAENRDPTDDRCIRFPARLDAEMRRHTIDQRRISTSEERAPFVEAAAALRRNGATVGLLELPQRPDAFGYFPERLRRDGELLASKLRRDGLFSETDVAPRLATHHFQDRGHLRPTGQALVSEWLAQKLARRLEGQTP
jgi:hypothetical protein